ncbi:MAG: hypothetical protein IKH34_08265 [Oscillospiraceae bacterium]|nr:hypothetical protein [Oscillospiraceae bacterium]
MTEFTVKLAGVPVRIRAIHRQMRDFLRDYLSEDEPLFAVEMEQADIDRERVLGAENRAAEGLPPLECSDAYLETLAIYRKLAERITAYDVLLFHGSVLAVDGQAYLFTARSGTGKSTHARLWREVFGERVVMINDDKPLLRVEEGRVLAYGTPWNGKHHLGGNLSAPLKALCILTRDETNHIEPITPEDAFPMLVQQCYRPASGEGMLRVLELLERLSKNLKLYRLGCNMEPEAARISYQGMQEEA